MLISIQLLSLPLLLITTAITTATNNNSNNNKKRTHVSLKNKYRKKQQKITQCLTNSMEIASGFLQGTIIRNCAVFPRDNGGPLKRAGFRSLIGVARVKFTGD